MTNLKKLKLINADRPLSWKKDIAASVDLYNEWFLEFAPLAYRTSRQNSIIEVKRAFEATKNFLDLTAHNILTNPGIVPTLRMSTAPPIARDRLMGLAEIAKSFIQTIEKGKVPDRLSPKVANRFFQKVANVIQKLLDKDIFPWLEKKSEPTNIEIERAASIVADRLCGALADPIIRNAQEQRQFRVVKAFLLKKCYKESLNRGESAFEMEAGTFSFRLNVPVGSVKKVNIPIDIVIQPHSSASRTGPILIEAKSAGDFTNTNKRRKEEATKIRQLKDAYGENIQFYLFLCGYFDSGYLGYEAAEGIDWIWEHRIDDLAKVGI